MESPLLVIRPAPLRFGPSSLPQLAQLPIAALQITRRFVVSAAHHPSAMRTCRAIVALADALGVPSIAPGIDDESNRDRMSEIGCSHGLGDLYPPVELQDIGTPRKRAARSAA